MMRLDVLVGLVTAGLLQPVTDQAVFRSEGAAVFVDVSVRRNGRHVTGLTVDDFNLDDNGRRQVVVDISNDTMPLDIVLMVDVSDSVQQPSIQPRIHAATTQVRGLLRADDRLQLLGFGSTVRESPTSIVPHPASPELGQTALYDALIVALMQRIEPGRRRLVILLTDGIDGNSLLSHPLRQLVLDRAGAAVHVLVMADYRHTMMFFSIGRDRGRDPASSALARTNDPFYGYSWALREVADRSGGRLYDIPAGGEFLSALAEAIEEYRQRYILRYIPDDSRPGWHELKVSVRHGGDVRHRPGYYRPPPSNQVSWIDRHGAVPSSDSDNASGRSLRSFLA
jgi:VWFA-related protein